MSLPNVISIFPIGIYYKELSNSFSSLLNQLEEEKMKDIPLDHVKIYGSYSENTYILNNKKYKLLSEFILKESMEYGQNVLGIDSNEYKFTQSWISHKPPNCKHEPHKHYNSIISGIIFYGEYDKEIPSLNFHKNYNYLDSNLTSILRTKPNNIINEYTSPIISVEFKSNCLILFPSYLEHGVENNNSNIIRKSLAFNIVPKVLGSKEGLTELKL